MVKCMLNDHTLIGCGVLDIDASYQQEPEELLRSNIGDKWQRLICFLFDFRMLHFVV